MNPTLHPWRLPGSGAAFSIGPMSAPFSPDVLAQVDRLGGSWREVSADADLLIRVQALSFPKRLIDDDTVDDVIDVIDPTESGQAAVDAFIALDAPLPDVPVTDELPCGVRWCGNEWLGPDITYQWEDGPGAQFPLVDLAADADLAEELKSFRELLDVPQASRAVLITCSDGYPNYHFIDADDPRPEDPAVWSTDHEGFFRFSEAVSPSLSDWLSRQLTDAQIHAHLRDSRTDR